MTAGNDYEAIQNYDRALAIDPNNVAALENVTLSRLASLENVASEKYTSLEEFSFGEICFIGNLAELKNALAENVAEKVCFSREKD